jgi:hypothetical protein
MTRKKRTPIRCQAFAIELPDGTMARGYGRFSGPITDKDREAIAEVVKALRKIKDGGKVESVFLTKPGNSYE